MSDVEELRGFVEEYMIAIRLGNHDKVPELASKICFRLVELLDRSIEERIDRDETFVDHELSSRDETSQLIESICVRLREQSNLASAYASVLGFVSLRVSFSCRVSPS